MPPHIEDTLGGQFTEDGKLVTETRSAAEIRFEEASVLVDAVPIVPVDDPKTLGGHLDEWANGVADLLSLQRLISASIDTANELVRDDLSQPAGLDRKWSEAAEAFRDAANVAVETAVARLDQLESDLRDAAMPAAPTDPVEQLLLRQELDLELAAAGPRAWMAAEDIAARGGGVAAILASNYGQAKLAAADPDIMADEDGQQRLADAMANVRTAALRSAASHGDPKQRAALAAFDRVDEQRTALGSLRSAAASLQERLDYPRPNRT